MLNAASNHLYSGATSIRRNTVVEKFRPRKFLNSVSSANKLKINPISPSSDLRFVEFFDHFRLIWNKTRRKATISMVKNWFKKLVIGLHLCRIFYQGNIGLKEE